MGPLYLIEKHMWWSCGMKTLNLAGAVSALALTMGMASAANANTYDLTVSQAFPSGPTYGVVTTTQNGANVDVSVTLTDGFQFVKTGNHDTFTFNTNDATFALADVSGFNPSSVSAFLVGSNPSFGTFTVGMECSACGNGGAGKLPGDTLSFTVANTLVDNFVPNDSGYIFSADIIGGNTTGAVGVMGLTPGVPEPATWAMMILGMGMVGAGLRMRRRPVLVTA
jgi:hypothetical protein